MTDSAGPDGATEELPTVYRLAPTCTTDDLTEGTRYHATVDGVVDYGMFVQLSGAVSGLAHESNYDGEYDEGDDLIVELVEIRENGDLSFVPVDVSDYETQLVVGDHTPVDAAALDEHVGEQIHLEGALVQINQTSGPTIFQLSDGTAVVPCAAFERAGVRAYPDLEAGDIVHVIGRVDRGSHGLQVEADAIERVEGERAAAVRDRRAEALDDRAAPAGIEPLIEWPALSKLVPDLERVARRLRRAALEARPVVIRHHADTDGMAASLPLERALEQFIEEVHWGPDAARHLVTRSPSRAPYYELEDAVRDLDRALGARARHGQQVPLVVMIDNGSTGDDVPAYEHLDSYGITAVAIDHHHPEPEAVAPYLDEHVNPYLHGEDYRITTGMLCVEIARMIDPEITPRVEHVPAVAGIADRSSAPEMEAYLDLARGAGYDEDDLRAIADALDCAAYWLRYDAGRGLIDDALGIGDGDRQRAVVELLAGRARSDTDRQLEAALNRVETERLASGVRLHRVDLDRHAHRFTYPPPGKTTGAIHDRMVHEGGEPAITVGYGPDFAVLRSDGVRLDIPEMVSELNEELGGAGVSGGGHLVVGSIRFVPGMREAVLDALIAKMATAPIDETLGAATGGIGD